MVGVYKQSVHLESNSWATSVAILYETLFINTMEHCSVSPKQPGFLLLLSSLYLRVVILLQRSGYCLC